MMFQPLRVSLLTAGALALATQAAQAEGSKQLYAQTVSLCDRGEFPKAYVRINTSAGDPLRVRLEPAGRQIGLIPDGWAVRVLEWSRNGYWVKVTSQYGSWTPGRGGLVFASAPDFAEGWVSAGYVQDAGRHCSKPEAVGQLVQPEIFGAQPVEVQSDWIAMADALSDEPSETLSEALSKE